MLYRGVPYLSFSGKETERVRLEKIYFMGFLPIYLKVALFDPQRPIDTKVYNSIIEHPELEIKDGKVYAVEKNVLIGDIRFVNDFIIKNGLIAIDMWHTPCSGDKRAIVGVSYKHKSWYSSIGSDVLKVEVDTELLLPRKKVTFIIKNLMEAKTILELFTYAKLNSRC